MRKKSLIGFVLAISCFGSITAINPIKELFNSKRCANSYLERKKVSQMDRHQLEKFKVELKEGKKNLSRFVGVLCFFIPLCSKIDNMGRTIDNNMRTTGYKDRVLFDILFLLMIAQIPLGYYDRYIDECLNMSEKISANNHNLTLCKGRINQHELSI